MNTSNSGTNASTHPIQGVQCDVTNCHYNMHNHICTAGTIKVGPQNATCSADTICATFRPQAM